MLPGLRDRTGQGPGIGARAGGGERGAALLSLLEQDVEESENSKSQPGLSGSYEGISVVEGDTTYLI